jgi:uncharacterized membrane protein
MSDDNTAQSQARPGEPPVASVSEPISQNISDMVELQEQELARMTAAQRRLEHISRKVAQPVYIVALLVLVGLWIVFNACASRLGIRPFDPAPFQELQGVLTFIAMLTATVVLIAQSRQTRLSEQRAHLGLQINLLTEQKVTKLIHLIEELRQDLPMVRDRQDPHVSALQEPTDTATVVSALKSAGLTSEHTEAKESKPAASEDV